ncbi:SirB2 family protein [Faucicola mancuniensis]|uniref:SirB2 family protein n=1 Tax=Faucicola mancuniensis TaxID=1309795 RepID=UPI0028F009CD|nr:SirB2 family protein [uncultured Moraxella sp.]
MKIFHMIMVLLVLCLFLYQFMMVYFLDGLDALRTKTQKIVGHSFYCLLIISGVLTVMPLVKVIGVPHWVIAKFVLLMVAISATIKATRATTTIKQAKVGLFLALIAYTGILTLAVIKPTNLF